MVRPREFEFDDVLTKAMEVFWAQGYEGTSLSDLESGTGLLRGSIYAAFGKKADLYQKALSFYIEREVTGAELLLAGDTAAGGIVSGLKRIDAFLQLPVDAVGKRKDRRGCFLCSAAVDRAPHCEQTTALVQSGFNRLERALTLALISESSIVKLKSSKDAAAELLAIYFGLRVMSNGGQNAAVLKAVKDQAMRCLSTS